MDERGEGAVWPWEVNCLAVPSTAAHRQLCQLLPLPLEQDVFLAYTGASSLRFAGFLITEPQDINRPNAFCLIGGGLEPGSALWRRDVRRQFLKACRLAGSTDKSIPIDAVDLSSPRRSTNPVQPWLFGLACVPLREDWNGRLMHPRPFCPVIFGMMIAQPEARAWILEQQPPIVSSDHT